MENYCAFKGKGESAESQVGGQALFHKMAGNTASPIDTNISKEQYMTTYFQSKRFLGFLAVKKMKPTSNLLLTYSFKFLSNNVCFIVSS